MIIIINWIKYSKNIQNIINKTVDQFRLTCYDEFVLVDKLLTKKQKTNKRKK